MLTKMASIFDVEWANAKLKVGHVVLFIAAVCISLIAISIWGVFNSLEYHLHDKETEMSNLSKTLSSSIAATLTQADTVILGVKERLEAEGTSPENLKNLGEILKIQQKHLPQIHGFFIYDEQGRWLLNSNGIIPAGANNSDRDYFIYHRDHTDPTTFIGPAILSRSTNEWIMTVSRRINHPDGSFAGVTIATVYLKYFLSLYDDIDIGNNGIINLASSTGRIVVRKPFRDADVGTDMSSGQAFALLTPAINSGTATIKSFIDGVERVISFRRIDGYPLVIIAAFDKSEILADWRSESLASLLISSILLVILSLLGYRLIKLMSQQIQAQKELQLSQKIYIEANKALGVLALEDGLTGLFNRRQFDFFIEAEIGRTKRKSDDTALIMIDVDFFKKYNDHYGHVQGDECLKTVSAIIKRHVTRTDDLAARYGGEEFAIVLPGTDYVGAFLIAEKIRIELEQSAINHSESPIGVVTISVGIGALSASKTGTSENLVDIADKALYIAKSSGRNRTVISN
ncbi:sensor domain-containing diguanylate cyclase [Pseudomonas sp. 10S4]|uniref:sensor domain-containing diguanylate cyclase n=1 Tax=Pseudomonas sp. 10S4 TaxID=3048583 RepID=UPI002AC98EB6|nr:MULTISPECIES: sensor domain-containing diguanylate cyclase [unclassified Pseudomonas]MEB0226118.1 sensor domain-containing diguanylate cyclase [Pseudomonas sp. 5S1]MEB0297621.1 sensor domain-containing diguanylate cyclase [Pseudomonas sp. 10S4]WPX16837.1 sensor domain-containing diguanylate cyclase [Pseudomonas sp. 10S4]